MAVHSLVCIIEISKTCRELSYVQYLVQLDKHHVSRDKCSPPWLIFVGRKTTAVILFQTNLSSPFKPCPWIYQTYTVYFLFLHSNQHNCRFMHVKYKCLYGEMQLYQFEIHAYVLQLTVPWNEITISHDYLLSLKNVQQCLSKKTTQQAILHFHHVKKG